MKVGLVSQVATNPKPMTVCKHTPIHSQVLMSSLNLFRLMFCLCCMVGIALPSYAIAAISLVYPTAKSSITRSDHLIIKLNNLDYTGIKVTIEP